PAGMEAHRPARPPPRAVGAVGAVHHPESRAGCPAAAPAVVAESRALGARPGDGSGGSPADPGPVRGGDSRLAGAPGSACGAGRTAGGPAPRGAAGVLRGADALGDRPPDRAAARHGQDAVADRVRQTGGDVATHQGLADMSDWLGMASRPRPPRPELKAQALA